MPSRLPNVHWRAVAKFCPVSGGGIQTQITADSGNCQEEGDRGRPERVCQAAEADCAAVLASSSNAVEMSRMLMTPIRLYSSITGRWRMWFLFMR